MIKSILMSTAAALISTLAAGASIIFERDMPNVPFVNAAAGALRANYNYTSPDPNHIVGDNFQVFVNNTVGSITVYEISNGLDGAANNPNQQFSGITLSYGVEGNLTQSSSTYTFAPFLYSGTTDYQSVSSGSLHDIYALTFSNLDF